MTYEVFTQIFGGNFERAKEKQMITVTIQGLNKNDIMRQIQDVFPHTLPDHMRVVSRISLCKLVHDGLKQLEKGSSLLAIKQFVDNHPTYTGQ